MLSVAHSFIQICNKKYDEIETIANKRIVDMDFVSNYADDRKWRIDMLKAILKNRDKRIANTMETEAHFIENLLKWLQNPSKVEINLRIVPPSFARFNRTYQIRSEAITFIQIITKQRSPSDLIFLHLSNQIRHNNLFMKEADLLRRIADPNYRKTCVRLLSILSEAEDEFHLNEIIVNSDVLMELKNETLYDWENFQMLKDAWGKRVDAGKGIYGRVYCLYDSTR